MGTVPGPPTLNSTHYEPKINYFNATENIDPMNDGLSCNGWSRIYANQKRQSHNSTNHLWMVCFSGHDMLGITIYHKIQGSENWTKVYTEEKAPSYIQNHIISYNTESPWSWFSCTINLMKSICDDTIKFGEAVDDTFVIHWITSFAVKGNVCKQSCFRS